MLIPAVRAASSRLRCVISAAITSSFFLLNFELGPAMAYQIHSDRRQEPTGKLAINCSSSSWLISLSSPSSLTNSVIDPSHSHRLQVDVSRFSGLPMPDTTKRNPTLGRPLGPSSASNFSNLRLCIASIRFYSTFCRICLLVFPTGVMDVLTRKETAEHDPLNFERQLHHRARFERR